jgi:hypothetical protein
MSAAMDLAVALRSECNCWFLKYIDKFLDDIESETMYAPCDSQVAGYAAMALEGLNGVIDEEKDERK